VLKALGHAVLFEPWFTNRSYQAGLPAMSIEPPLLLMDAGVFGVYRLRRQRRLAAPRA
jgi:hypothetical protein